MDQVNNAYEALAQLIWQVEAGADEAMEEQPGMLHWKVGQPASRPAPEIPAAMMPPQKPTIVQKLKTSTVDKPPEKVKASSLQELKDEIEAFTGCSLKGMAMNTVFADGNADADIMIIGEAPAEDDDRQGKPFAGPHGTLLDKMLASIGLSRETTYLTNMVYWRPPGGRTPSQEEIEACLPFVRRHIDLAKPKMIICFGATVAKNLLHQKETLSKIRGKWFDYQTPLAKENADQIRAVTTHAPSNLLRLPAQKRQAWQDLLKIKEELSN